LNTAWADLQADTHLEGGGVGELAGDDWPCRCLACTNRNRSHPLGCERL